jgi:hypothetical protein
MAEEVESPNGETGNAETSVEIHKPKAVHNWRELLTEIGIIVIGVLLALGAEQTVEALHWQAKVRDAEDAMRLELRDDDGPQAYMRIAAQACFDRQLDGIQTAIEGAGGRKDIALLIGKFPQFYWTWDAEAWKAALASDVGSHIGAEQMIAWSGPYRLMPVLQAMAAQEHADWITLQPIRSLGEKFSPGEADIMLAAVQRLRADNRDMSSFSGRLLHNMTMSGVSLTPDIMRRYLADLRKYYREHDDEHYRTCVVTPAADGTVPAAK